MNEVIENQRRENTGFYQNQRPLTAYPPTHQPVIHQLTLKLMIRY